MTLLRVRDTVISLLFYDYEERIMVLLLRTLGLATLLLWLPIQGSELAVGLVGEDVAEERADAFAWQNRKHYEATLQRFFALAEKEYVSLVSRTIKAIDLHGTLFEDYHALLLQSLQKTIYDWMIDEVLSYDVYCKINEDTNSIIESSDESDEDGFDSSQSDSDYSSSDDELEDSFYEQQLYEEWKRVQLERILGLFLDVGDIFTEEAIDCDAIKVFLEKRVQFDYSSLINEKLVGTFRLADDLSGEICQDLEVPKELLMILFECLWFDYDWQEFAIDDPFFIARTVKATLRKLQKGKASGSVKDYMINALQKLFSFNSADFEQPFSEILIRYRNAVAQKQWRSAFIEWSLYTTYRKVFSNPPARSKVHSLESITPALPVVKRFNTYKSVVGSLIKARKRASKYYTKVYLHQDTRFLVYTDEQGRQDHLSLAKKLAELKRIGMRYEPYRPNESENVFVPQLHMLVSKNGSAPSFVEISLTATFFGLPNRPLTRAEIAVADEEYYAHAQKQYLDGMVLLGYSLEEAQKKFKKKTPRELVHSERILMELFHRPSFITKLVELLRQQLGEGHFTVHSIVMLAYSTNSVCAACTPTLVSLMNSHEPGGFKRMLVKELHRQGFNIPRTDGDIDWSVFRLNIFVTAKTNFFCQAHDLTDEGQHCHSSVNQSPKTHNPEAKLYRPDDTFAISEIPADKEGILDCYQRFFFEFVGKDVHEAATDEMVTPDYKGIVTSSGSTEWPL